MNENMRNAPGQMAESPKYDFSEYLWKYFSYICTWEINFVPSSSNNSRWFQSNHLTNKHEQIKRKFEKCMT